MLQANHLKEEVIRNKIHPALSNMRFFYLLVCILLGPLSNIVRFFIKLEQVASNSEQRGENSSVNTALA